MQQCPLLLMTAVVITMITMMTVTVVIIVVIAVVTVTVIVAVVVVSKCTADEVRSQLGAYTRRLVCPTCKKPLPHMTGTSE